MPDFAFQPLEDWEIQVINARGGIPGPMVEEIMTRARCVWTSGKQTDTGSAAPTRSGDVPIIINIGQPTCPFTLEVKLTSTPALPQGEPASTSKDGNCSVSAQDGAASVNPTSPSLGSVTESDSEFESFVGEPAPRHPKRHRSVSTSSQGLQRKLSRVD
ncbi:hypothetical protein EYR40_002513 [Pleurotus pulmonarius]|nr:hypothetical protein EYR40_002513 [Pleurotus pulmonarius]